MNKNYLTVAIIIGILVIVAIMAFVLGSSNDNINPDINNSNNQVQNQNQVKEFKINSFYEVVDNKTFPQYSLKEITVKKGDTVKIEVTVTKGNHDFNIDEYNIKTETPLNQPTLIEFTADKVGNFVYYCSRPGHRENGHWGILKVVSQ